MNEELKKYQDEMARKRRIQQQALAILQRAKDANIPPLDMRIKEEEFMSMIDFSYFQGRKTNKLNKEQTTALVSSLFNDPKRTLKIPFIIIDGGDIYSRKRAGFALLFRMIAWDKGIGMHLSCDKITHMLQTINADDTISRNAYTEQLKEYDILFISECIRTLFKPNWETGSFFDEFLENREANVKPTIITMVNQIPYGNIESPEKTSEATTGQYLKMFTDSDSGEREYKNILRLRIK